MCEPATITAYALAASAAASVAQVATAKRPDAPAIAPVEKPPESQAAKMPDEAARRASAGASASGAGGPNAGVGSTFLTGPQGISNSMLTLGKNALLGA